jgi:hypothetical protein
MLDVSGNGDVGFEYFAMEETGRYLVLSWRLNPPYLIYTTVCALTALGLVVFNIYKGWRNNWELPTWRQHPLEEAIELLLCLAVVGEVAVTARLVGKTAFFDSPWCVFDLAVAGLSTVSMMYALTHLGRDGEIAQASLPFLVLRFMLQPMRFCVLIHQTLEARSIQQLEPISFSARSEALQALRAEQERSLEDMSSYA